jgi:hypothetical protein
LDFRKKSFADPGGELFRIVNTCRRLACKNYRRRDHGAGPGAPSRFVDACYQPAIFALKR